MKDEYNYSIIREGSLSKEDHISTVSGNDAEKNLPENKSETYTEEDPNNKDNIIVYGYFLDQWGKETRPKDISKMEKISKDPLYFQDAIWAQIMKNKDSFELSEKKGEEDQYLLTASLSPDQIEDEISAIENEDLRKQTKKSLENMEYTVIIEKETKLPREIKMGLNMDNQDYSETYTYLEYNSNEEIVIPENAKK